MLGYKTAIIDIEVNGCNTKIKSDFILDFYKTLINTTFHPMKKNIKVCNYYTDVNTENIYDLMQIYKMICSEGKQTNKKAKEKLQNVLERIPERKEDDPLIFNVTYVVYNHAINETRNIMGFFQHTIEIQKPGTEEARISFEAFSELRIIDGGSIAQTLNQLQRFVIFQFEDGKLINAKNRNQHIPPAELKKLKTGIGKERFNIELLKSVKKLKPEMLAKHGFFRTYFYENKNFMEDKEEHYRRLLTPRRLNKLDGKSTKFFGLSHNVFDILTLFYEFISSLTFIDFNELNETKTIDSLREELDVRGIKDELTYYNTFLEEKVIAKDVHERKEYNELAKRFYKFSKYYVDSLNEVKFNWIEEEGSYIGELTLIVDNEKYDNPFHSKTVVELLYIFNLCYILLEGNANVFVKNSENIIEKYSHIFKDLFNVVKQSLCFSTTEKKYFIKVLNQMYKINNAYYKENGNSLRNVQDLTIFDCSQELAYETNNVNIINTVLGLKPKRSTNYDIDRIKTRSFTQNVISGPNSEEALLKRAFIKDLKKLNPKELFSLMSTSTISIVDTTPNKLRRRSRKVLAIEELKDKKD